MAETDKVAFDDAVLFAAADLVCHIFAPTGFPMEKLPKVQAAIREHTYDRTPTVAEALYLHNADALDWLGADHGAGGPERRPA
jgi:uncharacterized protein